MCQTNLQSKMSKASICMPMTWASRVSQSIVMAVHVEEFWSQTTKNHLLTKSKNSKKKSTKSPAQNSNKTQTSAQCVGAKWSTQAAAQNAPPAATPLAQFKIKYKKCFSFFPNIKTSDSPRWFFLCVMSVFVLNDYLHPSRKTNNNATLLILNFFIFYNALRCRVHLYVDWGVPKKLDN